MTRSARSGRSDETSHEEYTVLNHKTTVDEALSTPDVTVYVSTRGVRVAVPNRPPRRLPDGMVPRFGNRSAADWKRSA